MRAASASVASPLFARQYDVPVQTAMGTAHNFLLIDDDLWFGRLVRALLAGTPYRPIEAEDGVDGISLLRQTPVDLRMTDIVMPGRTGLAVIDAVRSAHPRLRIPAVSGVDRKEYCLRAAEMIGADTSLQRSPGRAC